MRTVLIPTVKSGQGHTRTINNRNAENRTVSHLLSKWYETKMNTWSYFAGLSSLFSKLHVMPTLSHSPLWAWKWNHHLRMVS